MVSIKAIRTANSSLSPLSPTVVFVGSTSGIGLAAISALLKCTTSPKVYIIGRSQSNFAPSLTHLQSLNQSAKLIFIEAQVSLLKEVDRVCTTIKNQETTIDKLWLSQGGLAAGYDLTSEGLYTDYAITHYSRTLFMHLLLPLLNKSSDPRIISILAAGAEGVINTTDFGFSDPQNYTFVKSQKQGVTMMSLAMRELSQENPRVSFIHANPGVVSTAVHSKFADGLIGYFTPISWVLKWAAIPLMHLFGWTPEEAGEMGLYELTNERYAASTGKNFFRIEGNAENPDEMMMYKIGGGKAMLDKYVGDGTQKKVWEHTIGVFDKVL
jgi:NAD(P)-dependent dehydrogenase (short-subunit alcohol dehydrogenase family)